MLRKKLLICCLSCIPSLTLTTSCGQWPKEWHHEYKQLMKRSQLRWFGDLTRMPSGILLGEAFHIQLGRDPRIHSEHAAEITFVSWLRDTSVSLFRPLQPKYAPRSVTKNGWMVLLLGWSMWYVRTTLMNMWNPWSQIKHNNYGWLLFSVSKLRWNWGYCTRL